MVRANLLGRHALGKEEFAIVVELDVVPPLQRDVERPRSMRHNSPGVRIHHVDQQRHKWGQPIFRLRVVAAHLSEPLDLR